MFNLMQMRKDRKLTMKQVGKVAHIAESTYSLIEAGKRRPSIKVAKKIGECLGFDWTLFYADEEGGADRDDRGDQEGKERGH